MKLPHLLPLAAGVFLLASAQAQQAVPAATDANAPVTPLQYQSAFAHYMPLKETPRSPDKGWADANRAVLGDQVPTPAANGKEAAMPPKAASPAHGKHEHKGTHE